MMDAIREAPKSPSRRGAAERAAVVLIDRRKLERECIVFGIQSADRNVDIQAFASVNDWIERSGKMPSPTAIVYSSEGRRFSDQQMGADIAKIEKAAQPAPVVVLSPSEDLSDIIAALDCGARGYLSASLGVGAMLAAMRLMAAGGVFLPVNSLLSLRPTIETKTGSEVENYFGKRQAAVADRLRRGKANKIIAYELNMCESTVKVHIRNIMKKLQARNRTEAGFKLSKLFPLDNEKMN